MKKNIYFFICLLSIPAIIHAHDTKTIHYSIAQKKPTSDRAENAKFVLANIAQMIGQIGTIVEEPHNADNVGNAVTNIVNNIVKITVHAVHNKTISIQEAEHIINIVYNESRYLNKTTKNELYTYLG